MPFGMYEGRTLPEILFADPDYFFWLREEALKGALAGFFLPSGSKAI